MTTLKDKILALPLPEPLTEVRGKFRGEWDYVTAGDTYFTADQMRDLLRAAAELVGDEGGEVKPLVMLTLGGIDGGEYGNNDIEIISSKVIEALQEKLVTGPDDVNVPLYAATIPAPVAAVGEHSQPRVIVERNRVWLVNGPRSFMLDFEADNDEELQWYAGQLRIALYGITQGEQKPSTIKESLTVAAVGEQKPVGVLVRAMLGKDADYPLRAKLVSGSYEAGHIAKQWRQQFVELAHCPLTIFVQPAFVMPQSPANETARIKHLTHERDLALAANKRMGEADEKLRGKLEAAQRVMLGDYRTIVRQREALEQLLTWRNPNGTIEQSYIPGWLAVKCRAALADLPPAQSAWQPIETAPKDGTCVLIYLGAPWNEVEKAFWLPAWGNWQRSGDTPDTVRDEYCGIGCELPTHWQHLPPAPGVQS